ncbi:double-stranded RNA-binding protein 2-like [Durio zibethinus]|uniref:Double-stranded RNA-binding protein 2-like n=1 Tax=Durio zibethinus TaxID=66656 RepID=A0A6P5Z9C2_DURZI|nr:double-stranded RNA-binding protein 2-like [Durio zibethinus]XP_022749022.1 double-stranded RNA-binding protein 2-like [Durio zibethinus]XP_022749024.1 double-stranded RNA-binding protein 2-like [Durio zibethinus]XP_022749025.1 double-stranded RNA-binding protein 2-like [Durio zibethinus]
MYKNQLQELAQRSCFNLPAYACIREGPDHAPRFKATVNFNGEIFESPTFCSTLRQAEHAAAEVALGVLSKKGPSKALAARVLDETGVYKNLLQETAHRAGLKLPVYTTVRSGPRHIPVFSCTVELAGMSFRGETAKTKKQAQKNAAMTAWSALKKLSKSGASTASSLSPLSESGSNDEQEQVTVARYLASLQPRETNKSSLRFQHHGHNSAPIQKHVSRYNRSLFPLQHRSWAHSQISPEVSMYQAWLEEAAYHNQKHLFSLSSQPTSPHRPQIVPFIHFVFQPDHRQYFLAKEPDSTSVVPGISPVLYFSTNPVPDPGKSVSQVTIQEIEEKPQVEQEWLRSDRDSNHWEKNFMSVASTPSPSSAINISGCLNGYPEQKPQKRLEGENEERSFRSMPYTSFSNELESNQIAQPCVSSSFTDARLRPQAISIDKTNLSLQNPHASDYLHSNSRPQNFPAVSSATSVTGLPASFAAPLMVRTAGTSCPVSLRPENLNLQTPTPPRRISASTCSRRPRLEGMKNAGVRQSARFVAPAVHIRSVVPVCSAPPAKKPPGPNQERLFSSDEENQS